MIVPLLILILSAMLPATAFQAKKGDSRSNLDNCLSGLLSCEVSALSADEIQKVAEVSQKRNLDKCMNG